MASAAGRKRKGGNSARVIMMVVPSEYPNFAGSCLWRASGAEPNTRMTAGENRSSSPTYGCTPLLISGCGTSVGHPASEYRLSYRRFLSRDPPAPRLLGPLFRYMPWPPCDTTKHLGPGLRCAPPFFWTLYLGHLPLRHTEKWKKKKRRGCTLHTYVIHLCRPAGKLMAGSMASWPWKLPNRCSEEQQRA